MHLPVDTIGAGENDYENKYDPLRCGVYARYDWRHVSMKSEDDSVCTTLWHPAHELKLSLIYCTDRDLI